MPPKIRVAILDDHQSIIDGYVYRLKASPDIEVGFTIAYGEELEPALAKSNINVLLLDLGVPTAPENLNPYPVLHIIPKLLDHHPLLRVLVISMYNRYTFIQAVMEAGASGYILKDDRDTIQNLDAIIQTVASGGIHFSQKAYQRFRQQFLEQSELSPRQLEVLSLCAAYPDESTTDLAKRLHVADSTVRNLLSGAYTKLDVRTRSAAVDKARRLNLITPLEPTLGGPESLG